MPTATSEDTEITLGTGKMLLLFFGLVALCAVFFAMGFSLGRNSVLKAPLAEASPSVPSFPASTRSSGVKTSPNAPANVAAPEKQEANQPPPDNTTANTTQNADATPTTVPASVSAGSGYYVQVAAVSKQEDADALVDALKRKQYPAFAASTVSDKLLHVQVGPYPDIKDAEAMRAKLVSDGYNPILKK